MQSFKIVYFNFNKKDGRTNSLTIDKIIRIDFLHNCL